MSEIVKIKNGSDVSFRAREIFACENAGRLALEGISAFHDHLDRQDQGAGHRTYPDRRVASAKFFTDDFDQDDRQQFETGSCALITQGSGLVLNDGHAANFACSAPVFSGHILAQRK